MSRQKIQSVLRKAGIPAAKWIRSGQIRGWGNWTSGARVRDGDGGVVIEWAGGYVEETTEHRRIAEIVAALRNAGIECREDPNDFGLRVFVPAA